MGERIENATDELGTMRRTRPLRMLGPKCGRQYPRHLRQLSGGGLLGEMVQRPVAHALFVNGRTRLRTAEALEGEAAVHCSSPIVVGILEDLPRNPGALQHVRDGRPGQRVAGIGVARGGQLAVDPAAQVVRLAVVRRAVLAAGTRHRIKVAARPKGNAVGVGAGRDLAVIVVADGERFGQRKLERDVLALVMAHGEARLVPGPFVDPPLAPRRLRILEAVGGHRHEQRSRGRGVEMERWNFAYPVRLVPDALAIGEWDRMRVAKAADALQRSEIMVERAVLHHQDHDMGDVVDAALRSIRRNRERTRDARRKQAGCRDGRCRAGGELQELAATGLHGMPFPYRGGSGQRATFSGGCRKLGGGGNLHQRGFRAPCSVRVIGGRSL